MSTPVLHVLAGSNGAGKSTLATRVICPATGLPFVNADVIAAERWPEAQSEHAYEASQVAAEQREWLMASHRSFITETVFSHLSKVELVARAVGAGYLVHLHVVMVPEETSVSRVAHRVRRGGHGVPEQKIRERYERLWDLVAAARDVADRTTFYDNSSATDPFRVVARYQRGLLVGEVSWPAWTPKTLLDRAG